MRRPLATALLACMLAAAVHGDYKDAYRKGIQARNRGRWAEVARFMREAIAEESRETGERVNISGMDFEPYLPHYYLGLALFNTGDCLGALASWQISDTQATVRRLAQGANLVKVRKECESRVAASGRAAPPATGKPAAGADKPTVASVPAGPDKPVGPDPAVVNAAAQDAAAAITKAEEAARAATQLEGDALLAPLWKTDPSLGPADTRGRAALTQARTDLDTGRRESNVQRLQEALTAASNAAQLFEGVRRAALTRRDELRAAATIVPAPLPPAPPSDNRSLPPVGNPPAAKAAATAPAAVTTPAFTPPAALVGAARLFFTAQYQEASASLGRLQYANGPAAAHTALLRAATYYAQYLLGGEKDIRLLEQARQAVLMCRKLGPNLQPDTQAFSPRFVQYFASVSR